MSRQIDLDQIKKRRGSSRRKRALIALAILLPLVLGAVLIFSKLSFLQAVLAPVSFVARLVNPVKLKEVDGRVNVLVLGLDTRSSGWSGLTDTILIGSISPLEGEPALISIPRDFWLALPPCGSNKINTAYNCGGGVYQSLPFNLEKGIAFAKSKVEEILGIKIPYWVVVNFEGFKEIIDTLGGIEVCVENEFYDYSYPVPGRENAYPRSSRYEVLHFKAGCQHMNGTTALKYARSRQGTNGEGSDFARAQRQQKVLLAVKDKVMSLNLLLNPGKLSQLYKQITSAVKINASFGEIQRALEIAVKLDDLSQVKSLVLEPSSELTYEPSFAVRKRLCGNCKIVPYLIIPKAGAGSFTKIQDAIHKLLFGVPSETKK